MQNMFVKKKTCKICYLKGKANKCIHGKQFSPWTFYIIIWIFLNLQPVIDTKIELLGKIKIQTENYLPTLTVHVYALAIHVAQNKAITEDHMDRCWGRI